ncbi:ketopantoate reductase family protein [Algicella marina]|uniref:Ketopantoate reductase N-terminal domain-containing protein n=1 Tax=Algicella marina TaxID=2683284 RepID=A0A6P1SYA1_9RHOB|nr:2-dehydropantoate 2-reductase N-terminal domain-containing protein [Algicella marina]QHQ34186.1 hypothetical protein GO499_02775 [Algicella marina]
MAYRILILGASYGSLLGTKLLMAGHDVTLVCRSKTASLINSKGTDVRIKLRGEDEARAIRSNEQTGKLDAVVPANVDVDAYDLVALAMAEPQYGTEEIRALMTRIAKANIPCLSIMNMPPLAYLHRIPKLDANSLQSAYTCPEVWNDFEPGLVTLCSPDPQAFRVPGEGANILHVGLPTNFKAAAFQSPTHTLMLRELEQDIAEVRLDDSDVPVKLRVFNSLFVPFAKWSMLLTGNYRCVTTSGVRPIKEAVHSDLELSEAIYHHIDAIALRLGASEDDQVPFEKYARAANGLLKPSSVARSIDAGSTDVERVDLLVKLIGDQLGMSHEAVDEIASTIDSRLSQNRNVAA